MATEATTMVHAANEAEAAWKGRVHVAETAQISAGHVVATHVQDDLYRVVLTDLHDFTYGDDEDED